MIPAGKLRKRVQLTRSGSTADEYGQPSKTFVPYAEVWARIRSLSGNELFRMQQISPELTHEVTVRWQRGLTDAISPKDQVQNGAVVFDILFVNTGERNLDDVILHCKERLNWP